jgi:hypothetical protein
VKNWSQTSSVRSLPVSQSMLMPFSSAARRSLLHRLALARRQRLEEILVVGIAVVDEVELLVGAMQIALRLQHADLFAGHERDVSRGDAEPAHDLLQALGHGILHRQSLVAVGNQKPRAGCRRERDGALQLRIITAAGALEGIGPAVVEDIFALAVVLEIAGQGADKTPVVGLKQHVVPKPAGLGRCRA